MMVRVVASETRKISSYLYHVALVATVTLLAACGGSSDEATDLAATTLTTASPTNTAPAPTTSDPSVSTSPTESLDALVSLVNNTIALPRMSYENEVISILPGLADPVVSTRTGSFDDDTFSGVGTWALESDDPAVAEGFPPAAIEYRVVDEMYWYWTPYGEPPVWTGYGIVEFAETSGGNPLGSVDGDGYLDLLVSSAVEVLDVEENADGSATWKLSARADDLVPIIASGGAAGRLIEAGAGESGILVEIELDQDTDGFVSGFRITLDEWWRNAVATIAVGSTRDLSMTLDFSIESFDDPLNIDSPCDNPSRNAEDSALECATE